MRGRGALIILSKQARTASKQQADKTPADAVGAGGGHWSGRGEESLPRCSPTGGPHCPLPTARLILCPPVTARF